MGTMVNLRLQPCTRELAPGHLNARVVGGALEVPRPVAVAMDAHDVRDAAELVSFGQTFPTALGAALGWSPEQARSAIVELAAQLGMDPSPARRMVAFGARDPSGLR